jgi:hypothetical protein
VVEDTSKIIIQSLMGFWIECSLDEAGAVIQVLVKHLSDKLRLIDKRVQNVRTHVKLTLQALGELEQWPFMRGT